MCTVTYIPLANSDFFLTSNRDESPLRRTIAPKQYIEDGVAITYPKDEKAGGTWIGHSSKKRVVCLLNGGFKKHERKNEYTMSRGVVVKKILSVENPLKFIDQFNFEGIEPFTLILISWEDELKAYELVWDGVLRYFNVLEKEPKIWSSSTLYNQNQKELRKQWFSDWLQNTDAISEKSIKKFHLRDDLGEVEFSIKMKREAVRTVSVTSVVKEKEEIRMTYKSIE